MGKTVFTNGCFDIVHIGHVKYLKEAKALGDRLVVGLNTDSSVKRLKGKTRPINNELHRKEFLEALASVDEVFLFDEDTPLNLIKKVKPDILVKGGDYIISEIVGFSEVSQWGGQVKTLSFYDGFSTTDLIKKIKED